MADISTRLGDIASTYGTDTIFILGKGASADQVERDVFDRGTVIAINDAEAITPADITVFHADWVAEALKASGWRSRLYVSSSNLVPATAPQVRVPYVPQTQESSDLIMQRFLSDELVVEDVMFLTALKLARLMARQRGRTQRVYMVGFDFSTDTGYSSAITHDFSDASEAEKSAKISIQEFFLLNALYFARGSEIEIEHVGHRPFSALTPQQLNERLSRRVAKAESSRKREGAHVDIVAELTTNHFGDRSRLERMVRSAKAAGADYVKVQKRDVESFYTAEQLASPYRSPFGPTFRDYRHALELTVDDFGFLDDLCRELEIGWFASVLDQPSFEFMLQFDPGIIKLPSTISEHKDYLEFVGRNYSKGLILSTGMTDERYERWVLENFAGMSTFYLLQCNSAYPTPLHDCDVGVVRHYHDLSLRDPRIVPGYSSHDFGWLASQLAVAAGARMIEKHVKLGNTEWAHFDAVAVDLETGAFREFVDHVREAEMIVGTDQKRVNDSEHHKYFRADAA
ncbi:N-acetylneuraminate synthase family protein [Croceibacterium sp. TMG7-5b_MA50]|uniref:N-acetylneuraminate synthase family protein n=1 Tax=Croceibacterium sp. TMG7-5b_MA50 TaxID=3121290 RepID=UPI003221F5F5